MKVRNGFVSNSSTSSFCCDVCGEKFTGWDASPYDSSWGCVICPNEHTICEKHITDDMDTPMMNGCEHEFDREKFKFCTECGEPARIEDEEYSLSVKSCPICQFEMYSESEMARYLEKTRKVSRDEVFAEIKKMNKRRRKLYEDEYITHVCKQFKITDEDLMAEIKEKFATFGEYKKFIFGR